MNWQSRAVDAVSKERIWREHIMTEKNTARIHEDFRCNPLKKDPPTAESISKRPARFLDRSAVIMDMLQKRLSRVKRHNATASESGSARSGGGDQNSETLQRLEEQGFLDSSRTGPVSGRTAASSAFKMSARGMYKGGSGGDTARSGAAEGSGFTLPKLPKLQFGPGSGSKNAAAAAAAASASASASASGRSTSEQRGGGSPRTKPVIDSQDFDALYSTATLTPREKYAVPMTTAQEMGWWDKKLIAFSEEEPRFRYGLAQSEITRHGSQFVGSRRT